MQKKTKYKIVRHRGVKYLYYQKYYKFWFIKWSEWLPIQYPNQKGKPRYICNLIPDYKNLNMFMLKYLDVDEYFKTEYLERKKQFK